MAFPFTINYSRTLNNVGPESYPMVLACIEKYISQKPVVGIVINDNKLSFKTKNVGRHNVMVIVDRGEFTLFSNANSITLNYRIYIYKLFMIASGIGLVAGLFTQTIEAAVFIFLGLAGGNWVIGTIRQGLMLNEIAEEIDKAFKDQNTAADLHPPSPR